MKPFILIPLVFVLTSTASGRPEPGFAPKDVVRRMRQVHTGKPTPGLDDGEFLIDTSMVIGPAPGVQQSSALAFDGANFLVVWQDHRGGSSYDIYCARVTLAGLVLDPGGIVISQAPDSQMCPALCFDGTNHLVVWEDHRSGSSYDIYCARVTTAGLVLDPNGILVSQSVDDQFSPAVAFDGTNSLVVWEDYRSGSYSRTYGARVTPSGTVLDPGGILISQETHGQGNPAVAFDGTGFLVVWEDDRNGSFPDIYGARVTPAGVVLDPNGIAISQAARYQYFPALTFDGTNFLVVWMDYRSNYMFDIYGARVTPTGSVLDPNGIVISSAAYCPGFPVIAFDGANSLVVWDDYHSDTTVDIYGARVMPSGTVLDPNGIAISQEAGAQRYPALAFDGTNYLVAWQRGSDIYGARVETGGTVLDPDGIIVSLVANSQRYPALAFDGANYLVVWQDGRSGSDIYGARVTPAGAVLDPDGIVISQAAGNQEYPALGFDGTSFLVVWQDGRSGYTDIYGARVTPAGAVLDPNGIAVSQAANWQEYPALGFDGTSFLVVWQDWRASTSDIYGARVTPAGLVLDPSGIVISQAANWQEYPVLAFDGTDFLVVWEDCRSGNYPDIYGARVTPAGAVLDPDGIVVSQAADDQAYPALAFDGANSLVAWEDYRSGGYADIYGARVSPAGTVLDTQGIPISTATRGQYSPAVASDGTNSLVAWQDYRSVSDTDIYGARVSPAGTVSGEGPVVRQEGGQYYPKLAHGAGSQMFLVYQGWAGTVGGKTYNTDRIWGKMNPAPGVEEQNQSPTGYAQEHVATIVRGCLLLPKAVSDERSAAGAALLDVTGRKVLDLKPGPNDVSQLAPGVYFVRSADSGQQAAIAKVVIQK